MSRPGYYGYTVCVGGPMHGKVFDGSSYPCPEFDTTMPPEWDSAYSVKDLRESAAMARTFLRTRYRREHFSYKIGQLRLEGTVWLWTEYKNPNDPAVITAALGLMIAGAFEVS